MTSSGIASPIERDDAFDELDTVAVIVVTYNSGHDVLASLRSVQRSTRRNKHVVVVDNNSTDGIPDLIVTEFPDAKLIRVAQNVGFATAANIGMAATSTPYVLVLNPDTVITPGAVDSLIGFAAAHPTVGVIAPLLLFPDGRNQGTARRFPTAAAGVFGRRSPVTRLFPNNRWSSRFLSGRDMKPGDPPFQCDWVSGACMLVPRSAIDAVGMFDTRYFLFWEDADWCARMAAQGFEVWTVPEAVVVHSEGGSRRGWPTPVVKHFHRGAYLYWKTHSAPQWWNPFRWAAAGLLIARAALISLPNSKLFATARSVGLVTGPTPETTR